MPVLHKSGLGCYTGLNRAEVLHTKASSSHVRGVLLAHACGLQ